MTRHPKPALPWLVPGDPFPEPDHAWGPHSPAPGLLAAGGSLDVATLTQAYARGIFPWFGPGQPVLWWSPDPRMVLATRDFRLHRSLRQAIRRFRAHPQAEIRIDDDFEAVIAACASTPREGQNGTWIVPEMIRAYGALHQAGLAHSVETWVGGRLVGGLYLVAIGRAVFGESMFAHATDASKIALAALVALCRAQGVTQIDCQQNTSHLASLGAAEIRRSDFLAAVRHDVRAAPCEWQWRPVYWNALIPVQP